MSTKVTKICLYMGNREKLQGLFSTKFNFNSAPIEVNQLPETNLRFPSARDAPIRPVHSKPSVLESAPTVLERSIMS
jgi:hypothetical protein